MSETEPFNHAEQSRLRDERWSALMFGLDIDRELERSPVIQTIINALAEDRREATNKLTETNPSDIGEISRLQAIVRQARIVELALQTAIVRGKTAEASLMDEDQSREVEPV